MAMHGFDPVAYFSQARAVLGRPALQRVFGGATWRFRNEGNAAAFAANPEVYLPRFGGYDPLAMDGGWLRPAIRWCDLSSTIACICSTIRRPARPLWPIRGAQSRRARPAGRD